MSINKTGGYAFPVPHPSYHEGMTFRDYIASGCFFAAMQSATGLGDVDRGQTKATLQRVAGICFDAADAFIDARNATGAA